MRNTFLDILPVLPKWVINSNILCRYPLQIGTPRFLQPRGSTLRLHLYSFLACFLQPGYLTGIYAALRSSTAEPIHQPEELPPIRFAAQPSTATLHRFTTFSKHLFYSHRKQRWALSPLRPNQPYRGPL